MHVCEMAVLPCRSIAITSTCTTKLKCFNEIRTRGKYNFKNEFLEMVSQFLEGIIIY